MLVLGFAAFLLMLSFGMGVASPSSGLHFVNSPANSTAMQVLMIGAGVNGIIYIFGFEARYNRDLLVTTRMFLIHREYDWKDLDWIGDDGAYELVLCFNPGGNKAKVLKHCRGIEDFKLFAQEQIRKNR